jgi:hypothetical protein
MFIPDTIFLASFIWIANRLSSVPSWHNRIQTEPQEQSAPAPEDKRHFVGWNFSIATGTSDHTLEDYLPPVPIPAARSYAMALVNNGFKWVSEKQLKTHRANISQSQYFKLRNDWIGRGWCKATADQKTVIHKRNIIYRIAFEEPK